VPNRASQRQDALDDAGIDPSGGTVTVAFEIELTFEGLVDRFDDLT
jgi:hypothetical protein